MIKFTPAFVDKLENILGESGYTVRYERGNFQSGWCLLDHKRVVVLNKFLNTEGRVNTLVDLIPQLRIDFDKLTLNSQKIYEFLTASHLKKADKETKSQQPEENAGDLPESGTTEAINAAEGTDVEGGETPVNAEQIQEADLDPQRPAGQEGDPATDDDPVAADRRMEAEAESEDEEEPQTEK